MAYESKFLKLWDPKINIPCYQSHFSLHLTFLQLPPDTIRDRWKSATTLESDKCTMTFQVLGWPAPCGEFQGKILPSQPSCIQLLLQVGPVFRAGCWVWSWLFFESFMQFYLPDGVSPCFSQKIQKLIGSLVSAWNMTARQTDPGPPGVPDFEVAPRRSGLHIMCWRCHTRSLACLAVPW